MSWVAEAGLSMQYQLTRHGAGRLAASSWPRRRRARRFKLAPDARVCELRRCSSERGGSALERWCRRRPSVYCGYSSCKMLRPRRR